MNYPLAGSGRALSSLSGRDIVEASEMSGQTIDCPFCERIREARVAQAFATARAFADEFPVSRGHTLVVPVRHEADFFALSIAEQTDVLSLVSEVRAELSETLQPDGFNIGINAGPAAGQTVGHAHVHVIPRFDGDVPDPRGGIRWVLPERAAYWRRDTPGGMR